MSEVKQFDGSRRHILDWVQSSSFLEISQKWVAPQGLTIAENAIRIPSGWDHPRESRLFDAHSPFLDKGRKDNMQRWWLAHHGNIPNWDLIIQASSRQGPALVLLEAKAHVGEFDRKRKSEAKRADAESRLRTKENHLQICRAIEEAANALSGQGISVSVERHYQLSNRIATAWKLASLGIPNALIFLGFTGDSEIAREGSYFADDDHWTRAFSNYVDDIFPLRLLDTDIPTDSASFRVLSRSLPATRPSRPIAERREKRESLKSLQR